MASTAVKTKRHRRRGVRTPECARGVEHELVRGFGGEEPLEHATHLLFREPLPGRAGILDKAISLKKQRIAWGEREFLRLEARRLANAQGGTR